ncbi:cellulose biosynthesis protein BcsQ [Salmonella enterica]
MTILGLQGIRGGVGTTSITAALAWSLQSLGESVLVIDACPDNLLRLSFNIDFDSDAGWARALIDGKEWRDAGMRYTSQLDILPFGRLSTDEWEHPSRFPEALSQLPSLLQTLKTQHHYQWVLVDLLHGVSPLTNQFIAQCDHILTIVRPDTNCHVRLHQQSLPAGAQILVNDLRVGSQLQDDIWQIWLQSQRHMVPIAIHRDESMAESLAAKQPAGEYRSDALAAEEILTLANWCLLNYAPPHEKVDQQGSRS